VTAPLDLEGIKARLAEQEDMEHALGSDACNTQQSHDIRVLLTEVESLRDQVGIACHEARHLAEARAALRELVRLKDIKEAGPLDHATALKLGRDYEASKPAAWAEARRIVG
jgi:hypothetical protein